MKKILLLFVLIALITPVEGRVKYTFIKPDKHGKMVKIQVKGKDRTYYRLDNKRSLELNVKGPTTLKVISRLNMRDKKAGEKIDYKIYCTHNGKKTHFTKSAVISKGIEFGHSGEGNIGTGETFVLNLPSGENIIKLYLGKKDESIVYIRPLKELDQVISGTKRVAIDPAEYSKEVMILVKESEYDYFRIGNNDSLKLKIIGPATLRVMSRLEYDITMNGEKKYRMQVYEDGGLKNTFLLNTIISQSAVYAETNTNKILSRADDFFVEVPAGEHNYTFIVLDSGRSALLKFYIPEEALSNTP
ncbi:MAG: hypothetical protein H8E46_06215 [FCB group bacterium]|nr:hypothetical protein [FCB group bacterium]